MSHESHEGIHNDISKLGVDGAVLAELAAAFLHLTAVLSIGGEPLKGTGLEQVYDAATTEKLAVVLAGAAREKGMAFRVTGRAVLGAELFEELRKMVMLTTRQNLEVGLTATFGKLGAFRTVESGVGPAPESEATGGAAAFLAKFGVRAAPEDEAN